MSHQKSKILCIFSDVHSSPQLIAIVEELMLRNTEVHIILIGDSESKIAQQIIDKNWKLEVLHVRNKTSSLLNLLLICIQIIKIRPQVVFSSGLFATTLGMVSGRVFCVPKRIFVRHHSNFHHRYNLRLGLIIDRLSNHLSTSVVAVSEIVNEVLAKVEFVNAQKISIIHNGVSLNEFTKLQKRSEIDGIQEVVDRKVFRIGVISRLTEWKGVEYTAEAFVQLQSHYPHAHLHVVGEPSDSLPKIITVLQNLPKESYTLEKFTDDIPEFLNRMDAFVHVPIGRQDEAFGLVYIEALAAGVKCIFTESGVITELPNPEEYAFIVPYMSSSGIYENLELILMAEDFPKKLIPESWLNQFSLEKMATEYANLLIGER
jgi:glycosyltransferase involved in cell wall biosynthesis